MSTLEQIPSTNPPASPDINVNDTTSLRRFLIAGMKDVMQGTITTWQAKAACNFAQQIYNVTALEVKVMLAQEKLNGRSIASVPFDRGCLETPTVNQLTANNSLDLGAHKDVGLNPEMPRPPDELRRRRKRAVLAKGQQVQSGLPRPS